MYICVYVYIYIYIYMYVYIYIYIYTDVHTTQIILSSPARRASPRTIFKPQDSQGGYGGHSGQRERGGG